MRKFVENFWVKFYKIMADGKGFEPSKAIHLTRVPGVLLQPLGHPSMKPGL